MAKARSKGTAENEIHTVCSCTFRKDQYIVAFVDFRTSRQRWLLCRLSAWASSQIDGNGNG